LTDSSALLRILVAALGGAAIGVERQWSGHATGPRARFGGVRTFTMLGGIAGLAGWLVTLNLTGFAVVLTAGAVALIIAGYVAASRVDVDATTETAALIVVAAGMAAGTGSLALASGIVAVTMLLLVEKSRLHALVAKLDDAEMRAATRFGVMAVVILPLLPEGPIGPFGGFKPRALWLLVLFFTGLSFAGYLARRTFGAGRGYPLAGLLGGLISSTNTTFTFARLSQHEKALSGPLAAGAVGACTMLFPRVLVAASVLNLPVARLLLPYLVVPFVIGALALAFWWRKSTKGQAGPPANPLQLGPALQMALVFQLVLFAVDAAGRVFGNPGLLVSGAVLGLTDVDALTISMTTTASAAGAPAVAARVIAVGILTNCLLKMGLAVTLGSPRFARAAAGPLAGMALALGIALWALGSLR
jgi:uncharacterized membrane protein (DUF4010 family)